MECAETKWLSNEQYIREFNSKTARLRVPLSGSIALTHHCNLKCVHCYLGRYSHDINQKEMDTKQILSAIDEITDAGCLYLLITGGEPVLREDFTEIYSYAKKRGLLVTVFTNGTLLSEKILNLFRDLPPYIIEISLYGATASTYDKITGIAGSYEKCLNGIRQLLKHKMNVRLKTILMTLNNHEFFDMENIAKSLNVKFRFDAAIFPCINGDKAPLALRVSAEEAIQKEFSDSERATNWKKYFEKTQGQVLSDNLYNCGAGVTGFHIDPYGDLQPCLMPTNLKYNLSNGSFMEGWQGVISSLRDRKTGAEYICNQCEKRHLCNFCPAFFAIENGSENICSEYLCAMGNHRFSLIKPDNLQGVLNAK